MTGEELIPRIDLPAKSWMFATWRLEAAWRGVADLVRQQALDLLDRAVRSRSSRTS